MSMQIILLMSTALNVQVPQTPTSNELEGTLTTELRSRQRCIAEITEMIHVSPSEFSLYQVHSAYVIHLTVIS